MKIVWEELDIVGGIRFQKPKTTEQSIILCGRDEDNKPFYAVASLIDGLVYYKSELKSGIAQWLNDAGVCPICINEIFHSKI